MSLSNASAVFRFEWKRSATIPQIIGFGILTLAPVGIVVLVWIIEQYAISQNEKPIDDQMWGRFLFYLIPCVLCLLNLLLTASPLIHSEIEGKNWVYLSTRPKGRMSHLLGKYVAAVTRSILSGLIALSLAMLFALPENFIQIAVLLAFLVLCSSFAYASIFVLLGVVMHRRAMVMAVAYTLVMELLVPNVPAVINRFSVQYRLFSIYLNTMHDGNKKDNWTTMNQQYFDFYGQASTLHHLMVLCCIVVGALVAAAIVLKRKEYLSADDG